MHNGITNLNLKIDHGYIHKHRVINIHHSLRVKKHVEMQAWSPLCSVTRPCPFPVAGNEHNGVVSPR